ncbi:hypothetical protein ACTMNS_09340, partial [Staphylococcus haemolyticus]
SLLGSVKTWVFNPKPNDLVGVFAFIVKRFRVFRAPLHNKLKKEVEELRLRVATSRPSDNKSFSSNNSSSSNNNVDILKRISNLEKAVFGK